MPAIVELKDSERVKLKKLLKNLNLGFPFSGFAEAYIAMLDGAAVSLTDEQKRELPVLINNLNLGFAHLDAGKLLVGLLDQHTQHDTAQAMTHTQITKLGELLNHLNLGLNEMDVGGHIMKAVIALSSGAIAKPPLAWDSAPASTGTIGDPITFSWKGGSGDYDITATDGSAQIDHKTQPEKSYSVVTTGKNAGDWVITVIDNTTKETLTATVTMSAAAPAKTVAGKTLDAKVGGSKIPAAQLFTYSGNASIADVTGVTDVAGKATWDNTKKELTLADAVTGNFTVTFAVGADTTKGADISFTNATAKPAPVLRTLKVASGSAADKLTVDNTDPAAPKVTAVKGTNGSVLVQVGTETGAALGTLTLTNSDATKATATVDATNKAQINIVPLATGPANVTIKSGSVSIVLAITVSDTAP
ncbi:hypothetical protein ACLMYS_003863 [Salmonella enterica]